MNKSRHLVAQQARQWCDLGYGVAIPDLYGTGDSAGEFSEANWAMWAKDILSLTQWIGRQGGISACLWGLRLGCLLACAVIKEAPASLGLRIERLIFWQPVILGEQFINQFLRMRLAAGLLNGNRESVAMLRERASSEGVLEVAGYHISTDLIEQLSKLRLEELAPPAAIPVDWIEIGNRPDKPLSTAAQRVADLWRQSGNPDITTHTVTGDPFWSTQELASAPTLIEAGRDLIAPTQIDPTVSDPPPIAAAGEKGTESDNELSLIFSCQQSQLVGVLHRSSHPAAVGILLVVGGPQYRVGSHRQFVLLSRRLAAAGIPVFRFDYRGMGDSDGEMVGFEGISPDIRAAIDALLAADEHLREIVIWGLCDAATAACFYAASDARVSGLVLLNPWVRSEQGIAKTYLKHYYRDRILDRTLWRKVLKGDFDYRAAVKSLFGLFKSARVPTEITETQTASETRMPAQPLSERFAASLRRYQGSVLLILSGNDLTAAEFKEAVKASAPLRRLMRADRISRRDLHEADHTFSREPWREQVANWTIEWVKKL